MEFNYSTVPYPPVVSSCGTGSIAGFTEGDVSSKCLYGLLPQVNAKTKPSLMRYGKSIQNLRFGITLSPFIPLAEFTIIPITTYELNITIELF
jgi:hypothetical protein